MIFQNLFGSEEVLIQVGRFLVTLAVGVFLTRAILMPGTRSLMSNRKDEKTLHSIVNISGIIGLFLSLVVALQAGSFGNLKTIIGALAAALTVAVGFGMRDQVGNVVSGIFIHFDNTFIKGDYIKVGEVEGVVKELNLRNTVLNGTRSEKTVVPNSQLTNNPTKNYTQGSTTKTSINLKASAENISEIEETLLHTASSHDKVLEKPEPEVILNSIEDGIDAELHYWIKNPKESKKIRSSVMIEYLKRADKEGIMEKKEET
jgi:small-conductance mechanosensitive channel